MPSLQSARHDQVFLVSQLLGPGERSEFYLGVRRGEFTSLSRGAYVSTQVWSAMDVDQKYRTRVEVASFASASPQVFSHLSAAAMWRLPRIGGWPPRVHTITELAAGGRSTTTIDRHTVGVPSSTVPIDGVVGTTLARTVMDVAVTQPFIAAVAMADAALRL
jgi:hypothetical protein